MFVGLTRQCASSTESPAQSAELLIRARAPPAVAITAPADGAAFSPTAQIPVAVSASTADGTPISTVELYLDGTFQDARSAPPYTFTLNAANLAVGSHTLTTRARDAKNGRSTSAPVRIELSRAEPQVTWLSPTGPTTIAALAGAALSVQAAAPPGRTIAKVEFSLNGTVVATDTASPYQFTLERLLPGTYSVGARATDSSGAVGNAPPQQITVAAGETVNYLHTDLAGSPIAAPDASGSLLWRESYKPYGEREIRNSWSAENRQLWHGKPEEPGGVQYFGAWWYHPVVGRFYGVDPKGVDEGNIHSFSRYAYGNNNPYRYKDPDGRDGRLIPGGIIALRLTVAIGGQTARGAVLAGAARFGGFGAGAACVLAGVCTLSSSESGASSESDGSPAAESSADGSSSKLDEARGARDKLADEVKSLPSSKRPATVTGGYNTETGEVAAGCSGGGKCAEDRVVEALGGDPSKVRMTEAIRPRTGQKVPVCVRCEGKYGRGIFPSGTDFQSDLGK